MFALGRHSARNPHPQKEKDSGHQIQEENWIINVGEDSKTLAEGQHLLKASRPNEDLGRRLKHSPGASGGGKRDKIKAKLKERFLEREVQLKDPTDWEEEGDIRREEREGAQDVVGGRGGSNQNLVQRDQEPR